MAEVYWIHLPEHTDLFTQGYIGVTKHTALRRYSGHVSEAKRSKNNSIISNAIKKYGDKLIVQTIVICDIDYALDLEIKLRPEDKIGWNTVKGGGMPPISTGDRISKEKRKAMGEARRGWKMDEESREKLREAWKSRQPSNFTTEQRRKRIQKSAETKSPWTYAGTFKDIWAKADVYYKHFLSGASRWSIAKSFDIKHTQLSAMFKRFHKGWVPEEDPLWLDEFKKEPAYGTLAN